MAADIIEIGFVAGARRMFPISGTVKDSGGNGLVRTIVANRNLSLTDVHAATVSASGSGGYTLQVNGNHNDVFRLVCLGIEGVDNSVVSDHLREEVA